MEPAQRIESLYRDTLEPRIAALESLRTSVKGYITKSALCVGLPFAVVLFGDIVANALGLSSTAAAVLGVASFGLVIVGAVWAVVKYLVPGMTAHADYKSRFKREIATEVFRIVCPTATYSPTAGLARQDFDEAGLFTTQGSFSSDDRVHGTIGQTPFEAAEVRRTYSTGGKSSRLVMVFHGLFFHIDFNKSLRGITLVQPESAPSDRIGSREGLLPVMLENPAFEKAFAVYASDEVEARYVLTPVMMDRILALRARIDKPIFLAFKHSRAYLAVHFGRSLFEPGITATTSLESVQEMAAQFALAEGIVDELDLNTRIWTKGVDDSWLQRRP